VNPKGKGRTGGRGQGQSYTMSYRGRRDGTIQNPILLKKTCSEEKGGGGKKGEGNWKSNNQSKVNAEGGGRRKIRGREKERNFGKGGSVKS